MSSNAGKGGVKTSQCTPARLLPSRRQTPICHSTREMITGVERGTAWLLAGVATRQGPSSTARAQAMIETRGVGAVVHEEVRSILTRGSYVCPAPATEARRPAILTGSI